MKLTCKREDLLKGVQIAAQTAPRKHVNVSLDNSILLRATKQIVVSATDYNIFVEYFLAEESSDVIEQGDVLLPLDKITTLLRESDDDSIELEKSQDGNCRVSLSDGKFDLLTGETEDFPAAPKEETEGGFEIPREILVESFEKGRIARASEEGRYLFNHVLMETKENEYSVVTTDGRRLACYEYSFDEPVEHGIRIILPLPLINQVRKLCEQSEGSVSVREKKGKVYFKTDRGRVVATTRDQKSFPDYLSHMGKERNLEAHVDRNALLSATKKIAMFTTDHERAVEFKFSSGELSMNSQSGAAGKGNVRVETTYEGEDVVMMFDPNYVAEGLSVMKSESIHCQFGVSGEGAILKEGERFRYLVMPIMFDGGGRS